MNSSNLPPRIILNLAGSDWYPCLQALQTALESAGRISALLVVGENIKLCRQVARAWSEAIEKASSGAEAGGSAQRANPNGRERNEGNGFSLGGRYNTSDRGNFSLGGPQWRIPIVQSIAIAGVEASVVVLSTGLNVWMQIEPVLTVGNAQPSWQISLLFESDRIAQLLKSPAVAAALPHCSELTARDLNNNSSALRRLWLQLLPLLQPADSSDWEREKDEGEWSVLDLRLPLEPQKVQSEVPIKSEFVPSLPRVEPLFWDSPVGIIYQSLDSGILRANPAFERLIGYTETQLRHLDCRSITHPEDFAAEVRSIQQLIQQGLQRQTWQKRYIRRDGTIIWTEVTFALVGDPTEEDGYLLIFVTDLSYVRRAEQEIQQRRQREALLSEIAAQIRSTFDFPSILQIAVKRLRQALETDRVVAYQLQSDRSGVCAAEAVDPAYPTMMGQHFSAQSIPPSYLEAYREGRFWCTADIRTQELSDCYRQMLEQAKVRSAMAVAIQRVDESKNFVSKDDDQQRTMWGLLVVHHCLCPRQWTVDEQQLVQAVANQMAIAFEQASLVQQLQAYTQELEQRVKERTRSIERSLQFEQLIRSLTESLRRDIDEEQILRTAVEGLVRTLKVDGCYASLFEPEPAVLEVRYEHLGDAFKQSNPSHQLPLQDIPEPCRTALLSGLTCSLGDGEELSTMPHTQCPMPDTQYSIPDAQSVSISPISDAQGLIGAIFVFQRQMRHFEPDEVQLVEQVASQCGIAIRQSRTWRRLQEQNQELSALNRVKGELIANTSHELRTPLTAILGFSNVLLQQCFGKLNPKQKEYVERISSSGQHLLELINDILDLSRIEAGRLELEPQVIFLAEITESVLSLVRERAIEQGLKLELEVAPDLEYLVADSRRLKQILLNLLSNAVKFTPAGTVGLKVYRRQTVEGRSDTIRFVVWDTGIGIDAAEQRQLFSPFSQIDSSLSRKYPGTGLGLAIARKLAELHGGSITLESSRGKGARFTLELPLYSSTQALAGLEIQNDFNYFKVGPNESDRGQLNGEAPYQPANR